MHLSYLSEAAAPLGLCSLQTYVQRTVFEVKCGTFKVFLRQVNLTELQSNIKISSCGFSSVSKDTLWWWINYIRMYIFSGSKKKNTVHCMCFCNQPPQRITCSAVINWFFYPRSWFLACAVTILNLTSNIFYKEDVNLYQHKSRYKHCWTQVRLRKNGNE